MGMLEWLNHEDNLGDPRAWLCTGGSLALVAALVAAWGWPWAWLLLVGAGLLGWTTGVLTARELHQTGMPPPPVQRELVNVVIDGTVCGWDWKYHKNGFISGRENAFAIFERWILRLGYFPSHRTRADAPLPAPDSGALLVLMCPHKETPPGFAEELKEYVSAGGKLLVVDSPENKGSTSNELLKPFGLSLDDSSPEGGTLKTRQWPTIPIANAVTVKGGSRCMAGRPARRGHALFRRRLRDRGRLRVQIL